MPTPAAIRSYRAGTEKCLSAPAIWQCETHAEAHARGTLMMTTKPRVNLLLRVCRTVVVLVGAGERIVGKGLQTWLRQCKAFGGSAKHAGANARHSFGLPPMAIGRSPNPRWRRVARAETTRGIMSARLRSTAPTFPLASKHEGGGGGAETLQRNATRPVYCGLNSHGKCRNMNSICVVPQILI